MTNTDALKAEVVICGAGLAGIATAYFLAHEHGVRDVLLVDRQGPLMLTSDKSVEAYRNWWPDEVMTRFMNRSIDLLEGFANSSENAINLNRRGYLYVTTQGDKAAEYQRTVREYAARGLGPIRLHDGAQQQPYSPSALEGFADAPPGADLFLDRGLIGQTFPYLTGEARAVLHARRCGWLSAQQLGMLLLEEAKALGIRELRGEVVAVEQDTRGVCAVQVRAPDGLLRVETRRFVDAAGPFLAHVGALMDVEIPVHNVLHEKIAFKDLLGMVPRDAPMCILDDTLQLAWSEEEKATWEADSQYRWLLDTFPAGCHLRPEGTGESPWLLLAWGFHANPSEASWQPAYSPEFPEIVLRGAVKLVPGLQEYVGKLPNPVMHDGGFYTKARDNMPVIGPPGPEGAYVVGGLSGYGVMAAPAAGELGAAWVAGASLPDYADALRPGRFEDADYVRALETRGPSGEL